jgi:hypothetical protein
MEDGTEPELLVMSENIEGPAKQILEILDLKKSTTAKLQMPLKTALWMK